MNYFMDDEDYNSGVVEGGDEEEEVGEEGEGEEGDEEEADDEEDEM